ncbi:TauD/TfdA family dioxygenase [Nodosilinea sp. E11]|nr:TauD/TfdA family dioxygenase [Nodosilinea sp. E11]
MIDNLITKEDLIAFLKGISPKSIYRCRFGEVVSESPVEIDFDSNDFQEEAREIIRRYVNQGFALFDSRSCEINVDIIKTLESILCLGEPYIPCRYKGSNIINLYSKGVNIISSHLNGKMINQPNTVIQTKLHAFTTASEQNLHVDGTLEAIGSIKTSILLCVNPAISGGESIIFNSVAAFVELAEQDMEAAISLLDCMCLKRENLDCGDFAFGPAFLLRNNDLFTRYSIDVTSSWNYDFKDCSHFKRACEYLKEKTKSGSSFLFEKRLLSGQGIIIANDKVSHGRKIYVDSSGQTRTFLRSIYYSQPHFDNGSW